MLKVMVPLWVGAVVLSLWLCGCAQSVSAALVAGPSLTRVSHEVEVCLDEGRLRAGEEVRFVRQSCHQRSPKLTVLDCSTELVDTALVLRNVDDRCYVVRLGVDALLRPGDRVAQSQP